MLSFLRKIRRTLFKSGRVSTYLLYAIGEVVLVVLGILIALQINKWNNNQTERKVEQQVLMELKESTLANRQVILENLERIQVYTVTSDSIVGALDRGSALSDALSNQFPHALLTGYRLNDRLMTSGYKALENEGFNILRSDSLRKAAVHLYDSQLPGLAVFGGNLGEFYREIMLEMFNRNIIMHGSESYELSDVSQPASKAYLRSIILFRRAQKQRGINHLQIGVAQCDEVLRLIEKELK